MKEEGREEREKLCHIKKKGEVGARMVTREGEL